MLCSHNWKFWQEIVTWRANVAILTDVSYRQDSENNDKCMMTSSNGNTFRVTGPLCWKVTGEFRSQRPVTRSFDVFFDLHLNKRLSIQSWSWWFETPSCPLWRHCNDHDIVVCVAAVGAVGLRLQCLYIYIYIYIYIYDRRHVFQFLSVGISVLCNGH